MEVKGANRLGSTSTSKGRNRGGGQSELYWVVADPEIINRAAGLLVSSNTSRVGNRGCSPMQPGILKNL